MAMSGACAGCSAMAPQSASSRISRGAAACVASQQPRQPLQQRLLRHQHGAAGVRQHERQPLHRIRRVERQIRRARLQDAEQADHHLQRAIDQQTHNRLRTHPLRAQVVRQTVGVRIQRRVAQLTILVHRRDRIRSGRRLRREQLRQARREPPPATSRSTPPRSDRRSSAARISRPPIAASGEATAPSSRRTRRARQSRNAAPIEQVGRIFQRAGNAARHAVRSAQLAQAQRQVELRRRGRNRLIARPQRPQARAPPRRCSGTPASPGTADAATATATG